MQSAGAGESILTRRSWSTVELPADVRDVPTMLSEQERGLLYTLARDYADGSGAIVDAGCFLGGSSTALLAGVRDRPEPWTGPPVASYDRFLVERYTKELYFADTELKVGDSFRHLYDRNVAPIAAPHVVHGGDIVRIGWSGGPIDVLFVDVLKSWDVNAAVHRDFFAHLIPGRSVIVHQDYGWGLLPWIHMTTELMWDSLRRVDVIPFATHVFLLERPIPPDVLAVDLRRDLSRREQFALMDRAVEHNDGEARGMVELSKAELHSLHGDRDAALKLVDEVEEAHAGNASIAACAATTRETVQRRFSWAGRLRRALRLED
jgi:hypothetical protein